MQHQYQVAALGGTFDHFHKGHEHLLDSALKIAAHIIVGVVKTPSIKEFPDSIQPYEERVHTLKKYVASRTDIARVECIELTDIYGPTLTNASIEILVVSQLTQSGAARINEQRLKQKLVPLPVKVIDMVNAGDDKPIASSRIRGGEINRDGYVYLTQFNHDLHLTLEGRSVLAHPQGKVYPHIKDVSNLRNNSILVGDRVVKEWIAAKVPFTAAVVDGLIERVAVGVPDDAYGCSRVATIHNPPGTIMSAAASAVSSITTNPSKLFIVNGEEDLLVFPVVMGAPLGTQVFYGQPHQGIVMIEVTESSKENLMVLISKLFTSTP